MKMKLRSFMTVLFTMCLLFGLTACGQSSSGRSPENASGAESAQRTADPDEREESEDTTQTAEISEEEGTSESSLLDSENSGDGENLESKSEISEEAKAALRLLRECMDGTHQAGAVAYLGYRDETESEGDLTDWMWTNVPGMMEEMAFLQFIPSDRVLNGNYGDLYCIVPRDEKTSLAVNHIVWRSNGRGVWPREDEVLYRSEYAEPLLLFVRWEEFQDEPDVEVIVRVDGNTEVTWYPVRDIADGGYIVLPAGENYESLLMDFSSFGDVSGGDYGDDGWFPPTNTGLANTTWNCEGWMLELSGGGGDPDYAGPARLYCQQEDGQEYQVAYTGAWRMEDDCLRLELSAGIGTSASGSFPVWIDPSGEHLMIQQDKNTYACPPFFDDGVTSMELTLSYG